MGHQTIQEQPKAMSSRREHETWMNKKWRPAMAWSYMAICLNDFLIAPILNYAFFYYTKMDYISWTPITLEGGGLFHMAMGAIVGVTAWQRTQEKMIEYKMAVKTEDEYAQRSYGRFSEVPYREDRPFSE